MGATAVITNRNTNPNGIASPDSAVSVATTGFRALAVQVTGTYTGALSAQVTLDGSNWVTVTLAEAFKDAAGIPSSTIASGANGVYTLTVAAAKVRVTALAAFTGAAFVTLLPSDSAAADTLSPRDYLVQVGFGLIPGHTRVTALGNNPDVDPLVVPVSVWGGGGLYPWPTAALSLEALSDSANDTAAGTGARSVLVQGLDINYVPVSQTVSLNGTTAATVPTPIFRVNGYSVASAGSGEVNDGNVTLRVAGGGATHAIIPAGLGVERRAMYTVPAGSTLQVLSQFWEIVNPTSTDDVTFRIYFRTSAGVRRLPADFTITGTNPYRHDGVPGIPLPEKTDFEYRVISVSTVNLAVVAGWLGVLKTNALP